MLAQKKSIYLFAIFAAIVVGVFSYHLALDGPLVLDDWHNVQSAQLEELSLAEIRRVTGNNTSGPLGRPIPVATFAINNWFSDGGVYSLKVTNLLLHVLNFILVFWFLYLLLEKVSEHDRRYSFSGWRWVALISAVYWVLHPLHMSTVMYVVQRMTIMSTTFTLLALITYLNFRPLSSSPFRTAVWLGSVFLLAMLSAFCKEIGLSLIHI